MQRRILIAEDDLIARRVLTLFLNPYGEVEASASGEEAVEKFEKALLNDVPYSLVCLDISMPGLHGLEVLRLLRASEAKSSIVSPVPVLMLTGSSNEDDITTARSLGAQGFILKPIIESDLIDHLAAIGFVELTSR